jgi:class 3 adenylate cyclase
VVSAGGEPIAFERFGEARLEGIAEPVALFRVTR